MDRRSFVTTGLLGILTLPFISLSSFASEQIKTLMKTESEWRKILTKTQFNILRKKGTEAPFTSKVLHETRKGNYHCVACDLPLFSSETKFDSGTGWPSFYQPIDKTHLGTKADYDLGVKRTEYNCAQCGGHHGHVFTDGPKPTGLRYCSNGDVLKFIALK